VEVLAGSYCVALLLKRRAVPEKFLVKTATPKGALAEYQNLDNTNLPAYTGFDSLEKRCMHFGFLTECYVKEGKSHAQAFADTFAQVDEAEALGIDSVWVVEQHCSPWASILPSPMLMASAIATRTQRMRIGLAVQVLPLNNPLRSVEEACMVDQISQGRFDFGVGRSGIAKFYDGYNIPYSESRARFDESLDIILEAFKKETFSYQGQFYSFHNVTVAPKPVQQPHPPIWVSTATAESFPELGHRGFPLLLWFQGNWFEEPLKAYRKAWTAAGHREVPQALVRIPAYVGETPERARNEPRESTLHDLRRVAWESRQEAREQRAAQAEYQILHYDEVVKSRVAYGSPEEVVERLQEFKDRMGVSGFLLDMNFGGQIPQELVINSMHLLAEKVIPAFK
jgi:alkanesulfonate monooxygenase SsuD/methylene tetrahydromethanopterin reductase-like flavin-dependent oxidoreductase (luciferase family)